MVVGNDGNKKLVRNEFSVQIKLYKSETAGGQRCGLNLFIKAEFAADIRNGAVVLSGKRLTGISDIFVWFSARFVR